ncbi:MAG: GGDEF domain-containing protein, partial [Kangiellaceae bacterium]|nr:GGDEF domain-containing protein [Kangiellaceae bacterium]
RQKNQVSIIYIDLDDFKLVNDLYGHQMGDKYLVASARSLQKSFRETDLCARVGGDEFVVLLDDNTLGDSIKGLLSRLNQVMSESLFLENTELSFKYSLGIATFPKHAASASELLNYADQQMYLSKKVECEL